MAEDRSSLLEILRKDYLSNTFNEGTFKALNGLIEIEHESSVSQSTELLNLKTAFDTPQPLDRVNVTGQTPFYTGVASGGGITSLSKVGAGWSVNAYSDNSAVLITSGTGIGQCRKIVSNTAQELTISGTFDPIPDNTSNFKIIYVTEVTLNQLNAIFSIDLSNNFDTAIILPSVASIEEGFFIKTYIEKQGTGVKSYNVCKDGNTQIGQQQGELQYQKESVTLYSHKYLTNHWDVLETAFITRFASTYISTPVVTPVTGHLTYAPTLGTWTLDAAVTRRFSQVTVSGSQWLQYEAIVPEILQVNGRLTISPDVNGAQRIDMTIRYYNKAANSTTDLVNIETSVDFSNTADYRALNTFKGILFSFGDRVQLVDKNDNISRTFTPVKGIIEII